MSNVIYAEKSILTPPFRVSYPKLVEPDIKTKKYGIKMLFPKETDISEILNPCAELIKKFFGSTPVPAKFSFPVRPTTWDNNHIYKYKLDKNMNVRIKDDKGEFVTGDRKDGKILPEEEGIYAEIKATTSIKPTIYSPTRVIYKKDEEIKKEVYGGCWCRAYIKPMVYSQYGPGLMFILNNVMKIKNDKPFSGFDGGSFDEVDPAPMEDINSDEELI